MPNPNPGLVTRAFPEDWTPISKLSSGTIMAQLALAGYKWDSPEELVDIIMDLHGKPYQRSGTLVRRVNGSGKHT